MDDAPKRETARRRAEEWLRWSLLGLGFLLPALSLAPFGSVWLWQNGYLLYWALAALCAIAAWFLLVLRLFRKLRESAVQPAPSPPDPAWTERERAAWVDVQALAAGAEPGSLTSREAAVRLALDAIERVARRLHPEVDDPLWRFTVPEVLTIIERVSARLRGFVDDTVPFSDRLTVAQVLAIYRWRGAVDVLDKAYVVWRIARLANPAAAATHELRERLSREVVDWGRKHFARVLVETYVKEVGRAAIDLYGGRLRSGRRLAAPAVVEEEAQVRTSRWRVPRLLKQAGRAGRLLADTLKSQKKRLEK